MSVWTLHQSEQMSVFLSNNKTKASLTEYLSSKLLEHYKVGQKPLIVSTANGAKSNHVNVEHLTSTQEEADTMIILHAVHASQDGYTVHIFSPHTDVFILAIRSLQNLGNDACMFLGTGDKHRCVPLEPIYDSLGEKVAAALPGFH